MDVRTVPDETMYLLFELCEGRPLVVDDGDLCVADVVGSELTTFAGVTDSLDDLLARGWAVLTADGESAVATDAGRYWMDRWARKRDRGYDKLRRRGGAVYLRVENVRGERKGVAGG